MKNVKKIALGLGFLSLSCGLAQAEELGETASPGNSVPAGECSVVGQTVGAPDRDSLVEGSPYGTPGQEAHSSH